MLPSLQVNQPRGSQTVPSAAQENQPRKSQTVLSTAQRNQPREGQISSYIAQENQPKYENVITDSGELERQYKWQPLKRHKFTDVF